MLMERGEEKGGKEGGVIESDIRKGINEKDGENGVKIRCRTRIADLKYSGEKAKKN